MMSTHTSSRFGASAIGLFVAAAGLASASAVAPSTAPLAAALRADARPAAVPGAQLWVKRYNGLANGPDAASAVAVSPGGSYHIPALAISPSGRVVVACTTGGDYTTIAYQG